MNIDTMRAVDKWAGIPLTFFLTLPVKLFSRFKKTQGKKPQRVLFIELSEMGSTILVNPALEKTKTQLGAEVFFVIFRKNKPSLDLLHTIPNTNIYTIREHNIAVLALDTLGFLLWARSKRIDTVVDLELFSRFTALLTGLCGAAFRVGFHSFHNEGLYRGDLLTHKVAYNPHVHIAKNFIALVNALLAPSKELPFSKTYIDDKEIELPVLTSSEAEIASIRALIKKRYSAYDSKVHKIVLINPNASELLPQRRWMPERYVELIQRILKTDESIIVLITGAPSEAKEADEMCARTGKEQCVNFAGATPLQQLPALYNVATLMVTNDSGPGHFSSITALPTFVLFGPETPALYGSLGNSTPIYAGLACSPCVSASNHRKTPCQDNKCLQAISVDQVFSLVKEQLQQG
ncbi:glycosyltransferase family 9 protein [Desulfogranum marinum]|uniref:glycosyltransferase family 9 protein n=1 Tax=Desulfogranum marinum TaxID=453220 RepID=UPI0029C91EEB|nr:glycosyltransferase family 9 protein [Desulfogranum marinum]